MGADVERPLRRRPARDLSCPLEHILRRQALLQLAPDVDALDQRAGLVVARPAGGQRRVQVEVAVDQRRGREPALGVDRLRRVGVQAGADPDKAAVLDGDVHDLSVDTYISDEEVHRVTLNRYRDLRTGRWTRR